MKYIPWFGRGITGIYFLGFAAMFSFVMYANFRDGDVTWVFTDPLGFLYVLGLALFLAFIWPIALYFMYMLTNHH